MAAKAKKTHGTNSLKQQPKEGGNSTATVALITTIGTVMVALIAALFTFPPFIAAFQKDPTPTPTVTLTITPMVPTDTPSQLIDLPLVTDTPSPTAIVPSTGTATPTATETSIPSSTFTESPLLSSGMNVLLRYHANKMTGKAPLTVEFDARDSFLRESDGKTYPCKGGPCSYTWEVYQNGQKIGKSTENSTGIFRYTFGKKGTYSVTVYICRGQDKADCKGSGTPIEVK